MVSRQRCGVRHRSATSRTAFQTGSSTARATNTREAPAAERVRWQTQQGEDPRRAARSGRRPGRPSDSTPTALPMLARTRLSPVMIRRVRRRIERPVLLFDLHGVALGDRPALQPSAVPAPGSGRATNRMSVLRGISTTRCLDMSNGTTTPSRSAPMGDASPRCALDNNTLEVVSSPTV